MRRVLIGFAALLVLLVAAALVVPSLIDWNGYKAEIAARVKAATGRDLVIGGDLDLALIPSPHLSVADVRLANIAGGSEDAMVRLASLDIRIAFLPLLRGRIEVVSITVVEPVILLETLADGRNNWTFAPPGAAAQPASPAAQDRAGAPADAGAFRLDSLRIRRGTLVWRDGAEKHEERFEKIEAQLQAGSLNGPFQARGSLVARGVPLDLLLSVGALSTSGGAASVSLSVMQPDGEARADFAGTLAGPVESARLNGKLDVSAKNLARLAATVSGTPDLALPAQPFGLSARVTGSPQGGDFSELEIDLGGARLTGEARFGIADGIKAEAKLRATRIDLGPWLDAPSAPSQDGTQAAAPARPADRAAAAAPESPFVLPADVDASVELAVDAVTYGDEAIRDVRLAARLSQGRLAISQASLRLPGGGEVSLTGSLAARQGRPNFDGTVDARSDNLRSLFRWMKLDAGDIPADRLRKFALSARLRGDDRQLQLLDAKISLDTSRIDAGVTLALRRRVGFGASVTIDQLNLDAYLPPDRPAQAAAAPAGAPPAGSAPDASAAGPLAALGAFDANLRLQIGNLTWRRTQMRDIRFDGTLAQGTLTVRDASVASLAGTSARLNGTVGGFDRIPVFRGAFSADSNDIGGLLRVAGLDPSAAIRTLGKVSLRGKADGGAERLVLDAALEVTGGKFTLAGAVEGLSATPRIEAKIAADHSDMARLARAFGAEIPADRKIGPMTLAATVAGDEKALKIDAALKTLGGALNVAGGIAGPMSAAASYDLALNVSHPDGNALLKSVAPDYGPAGGAIGPLRLEGKVKGTAAGAALTDFRAQAGKAALSGGGRLVLDGARPKLVASLTGNELDLNPFLPAEAGAPQRNAGRPGPPIPPPGGQPPQPPQPRFSSEPFDFSTLGSLDADLSVGAEAVVWRNLRIEKPAVKATLADGLLTVEQFAGRLFDGAFKAKGKLNGKGRPALDGTLSVEKANVGKALFETASFDVAGGTMDFSMAVAGAGASPRAMVAALDGKGRLDVRDGVVKGFDLKAVSDRLKNIDGGLDIISLFGAAMGGGQTPFSSLAGTFTIEKGVLRTDDLALTAEAGAGTASGFADLPRWTMDFKTEFRLTEHPNAPPFGMTVRGPIDNPQRVFQIQELQRHLLQRGVGTLLRKVLPDTGQPEQQSQQPDQPQGAQPQRPRPEDILRDLLKGLGR